MKKLIMTVAIVCAACVSQAAAISWGNSASSKIVDLTGTAISASKATTYALQVFLVDANGNNVAQATGINSMTAGLLTGTNWTYTFGEGEGQYDTGDLFSVVAKMTVDGKAYEMVVAEDFALTAVNNSGTDTFAWPAGTYGGLSETATVGKWSAAAVPEPTSGLLLLLGVAGLALKRKRA